MEKIILSGAVGIILGFTGAQLFDSPIEYIPSDHHTENHHDAMNAHSHKMTNVADGTSPPSVSIEAIRDSKDGYNVRINTENYTLTPEAVNQENIENEGHAHIYVNDKKIARLYSNWFHISGDLFKDGENEIRVTLNANDHSEWSVDNASIADSVIVTK